MQKFLSDTANVRSRLFTAVLIAYALGLAGCGDDRGLVPVRGKITFDGNPMPGKGYLRFVPLKVAKGYVRRSGIAQFEVDGAYRVKSFQPNDGLFPGEYAIFPFCWEVEPSMTGPPQKSFLPKKYSDEGNSPFRLIIEEGQNATVYNIDIDPLITP